MRPIMRARFGAYSSTAHQQPQEQRSRRKAARDAHRVNPALRVQLEAVAGGLQCPAGLRQRLGWDAAWDMSTSYVSHKKT